MLTGDWRLHGGMPPADRIYEELTAQAPAPRVAFDTTRLGAWDSGLLAFLLKLDRLSAGSGVTFDPSGLPEGVRRLLRLASAVPERADARRGTDELPLLERVGRRTREVAGASGEVIGFIGAATLALGRLLRGRARLRGSDFLQIVQEVGAQALPIVGLVSFLVGMILAFLGAIQLVQFGAQIYVADLVGIGMARDMAAMMVGVILAGRTGAAFAAQLGTMQVNEEIDALVTLGLSPMEFLVLPRMLALILMTPAALPLCESPGDPRRDDGRRRSCSTCRRSPISRRPSSRCRRSTSPAASQERRLRHRGGGRGLPARHAVRAQRGRGRRGDDLGGGDQHRLHRHRHGAAHRHLRCPRHLSARRAGAAAPSRGGAHRRCATSRSPTAASCCCADIDFAVRRGDVFTIMGGTGCGKTTLMRAMIGLKRARRRRRAVWRDELLGGAARGRASS